MKKIRYIFCSFVVMIFSLTFLQSSYCDNIGYSCLIGDTVDCISNGTLCVSAQSCVLVEADSGSILYSKNCDKQMSMASTTKIMTGLIALESEQLDEIVTITKEMAYVEGSSLYLKVGDKISLKNLVAGLMIESGNDCANAIAITVGGTIEGFVNMMNNRAKELGLVNTHFETPSGLDGETHYTTASDLAKLAIRAMNNDSFKAIVSQKNMQIELVEPSSKRQLQNHNRLLRELDGCIGVKTGFTKKSGRCLVSCCEREGVRLVCVTLNCPDDWLDHKNMINLGFEKTKRLHIQEENFSLNLNVVGGEQNNAVAYAVGDFYTTILDGDESKIKMKIEIENFYYAPILKGSYAGRLIYTLDNRTLGEIPLVFNQDIPFKKVERNFFEKILNLLLIRS